MTSENNLNVEISRLGSQIEKLQRETAELKEQRDHAKNDQKKLDTIKSLETERDSLGSLLQATLECNLRLEQETKSLNVELDQLRIHHAQMVENRMTYEKIAIISRSNGMSYKTWSRILLIEMKD